MAEVVRMPKLSDTMTEGVVAEWHKKVGDHVDSGDLLAEIETDKATMEFESFQEGKLLYIGVESGQTAPVDSILAILGEDGEDVNVILEEEKNITTVAETVPESVSTPEAESTAVAAPTDVAPQVQVATPVVASNGRVKASPLARKMAEEKGFDIAQIPGSGDGGRVVKADVQHFVPAAATQVSTVGMTESYNEVSVSQMRKTIARRLGESKFSAPHFYLTIEIDMDNAMAARKAVNNIADVKISFNDFVIKASAMALKKHPVVNSAWLGDKIRFNDHVHVGVAVAVDEGLLVPVVRFADTKSLSQISKEVKELAGKARDKKLQPSEWEGNTFSISNLGMFGIEEFTAIINPPDSCIMAVGGIIEKPVVKNGQVVPGNVMKVTMSCDHRTVDGASGAAFLNTFKGYLENPITMMA
jgi:pyruvate dehydrogenase E2 component (dihydrolipoamide acetyltransferase)